MQTASAQTNPSPTEAVRFTQEADRLLDEMEIYLAPSEGADSGERQTALRRRFKLLGELAGRRHLTSLKEACLLFQAPICTIGQTPSAAQTAAMQAVPEFLRCILALADAPAGELPEGFEAFVASAGEEIVGRILGRAEAAGDGTASEAEAAAPEADGDSGESFGALPAPPMRVLVCDDEEMVREYILDLIGQGGHLSLGAEDGRAGLAAARTGFFDLVLTDINMPGMDGIQLLRQVKTDRPEVEVIIITGYASLQNATEALRFGAYDYLTKPFQGAGEIHAVLNRVRDNLQLRAGNRRLMQELKTRNRELNRYAESLEDALRSIEEKKRALLHADRMATLGVLSAGVAHEINNPTTFIRGNIQTMGKFWELMEPLVTREIEAGADRKLAFIRDEMPQLLRDMTAGTERITKIVSGLRSFSHQGNTNAQIETDIGECVQSALDLVHNRIKNTVQVENELPELPAVQGDPQKLTQVFVNLVVNAADAMEGRSDATIRIGGRADGQSVTVEIADNGPGIPEPIRAKIFDPFFTTKSVGKGTGLGLSIILGIVQEHGGRITVERAPGGGGALFRVVLPRDREAGLPSEPGPERARVLVVEDDPQIRQVMETALNALGTYEVASAKDGREGLERIEATRPEAVILDIMLPGMDGFEVLQRIREAPALRETRVICMTAMDQPGVRDRLKSLGADATFFKPIRFRELFETLGRLARPASASEGETTEETRT